jgi:hypothetical protein
MRQSSLPSHEASHTPTSWPRSLLVVLLALVTLLSGLALAHAEEPNTRAGDPERRVAVEVTSTAVAAEAWREAGPHCRHGRGEFTLPQGVPRVDRQEIEFDDALRVAAARSTPPLLVPLSCAPRYRPAKSGVPVYLLTKRLRL